jgi:Glycosyl hydrolase catalytic core
MGISWAYDWGNSPQGTILSGAEFVPMLWGLDSASSWNAAAKSAIASGSTHLLSYNEPDLSSQSNISPSVAATNHILSMNPLAGNGVQIGSPAVTNGAGTSPPMGIDWLNQFFTACNGKCQVDFVAFHWYDTADSIDYFKQHVQDVINAAAAAGVSKVWLTEFQAAGTDAEVEAFLAEALPFLDSTPAVERYAYFMCATGAGNLVDSSSSLSGIGQAYAA